MNNVILSALAEGFETDLYKAAHQNLSEQTNPLRLNNFAYAMRELTSHLLERLSPDNSVLACSWYRNETEKEGGVSRRQRARYAIQGGLSDSYVHDVLELETEDIHSALTNAFKALNKYTHIGPRSFNVDIQEVSSISSAVENAVIDFLNTVQDCRDLVTSAIIHLIDKDIGFEAISNTIGAIDEVATHHSIDEVITEQVEIISMTHDKIEFLASGTIGADLQWGSNSDIRKGEGAILHNSFPFTCRFSSPVSDPENFEMHEDGLLIDESAWYGNQDEEEDYQEGMVESHSDSNPPIM